MNPSLLSYFKHLMGFDVSMAKSFYETCLAATKQYYCMDIDCLKSVIVKDGKGINESNNYDDILAVVDRMLADNPESEDPNKPYKLIQEFKAAIKTWVESDSIRKSFMAAEEGQHTYDQVFVWGDWSFDIWYWPVEKVIKLHGKDIPLIAEDVAKMADILKELVGDENGSV